MVDPSSPACQVCKQAQAFAYCACQTPPIPLCNPCLPTHQSQSSPLLTHSISQIAPRNQLSSDYQLKLAAILKGSEELRQNVARMDQCIQEFQSSMESVIADMMVYRDKWIEQLQIERNQINAAVEAAIEDVNICLDQGKCPSTSVGLALWCGPLKQLNIFNYRADKPDVSAIASRLGHIRAIF